MCDGHGGVQCAVSWLACVTDTNVRSVKVSLFADRDEIAKKHRPIVADNDKNVNRREEMQNRKKKIPIILGGLRDTNKIQAHTGIPTAGELPRQRK